MVSELVEEQKAEDLGGRRWPAENELARIPVEGAFKDRRRNSLMRKFLKRGIFFGCK